MTDADLHPAPIVRWFHRRTMAYASLVGILAYPPMVAFTGSQPLADVAWPVLVSLGGVVGSYTGFSTWETVKIQGGK